MIDEEDYLTDFTSTPTQSTNEHDSVGTQTMLIVISGVLGALLIMTCFISCCCICYIKRKHRFDLEGMRSREQELSQARLDIAEMRHKRQERLKSVKSVDPPSEKSAKPVDLRQLEIENS